MLTDAFCISLGFIVVIRNRELWRVQGLHINVKIHTLKKVSSRVLNTFDYLQSCT